MKNSAKLTSKQEQFCIEYLKAADASAAYRAAYDAENMTPKTINECASRLLADRNVAARIAALRKAAAEVAIVNQAQVIAEAVRIALSDAGALFDERGDLKAIKILSPEIRACIASVEIDDRIEGSGDDARSYRVKTVKLWDKNSA
ncbi:MAG: terminase small subunit, partial [Acidobacteriota bacterium]